jgi:hypothetical protein
LEGIDKERVDDEFQLHGDQPSWRKLSVIDNSRHKQFVAHQIDVRYAADDNCVAMQSNILILAAHLHV